MRPTGRVASQASRGAAIADLGYPVLRGLGSTWKWKVSGAEHIEVDSRRAGCHPIHAFWHGRILPATLYFQRRGIVVITSENLRRRVDRANHHEVRLRHRSRLDVAWRAKALLQMVRDVKSQGRGIHARWTAWPGGSGAARRGLAGEGDRQSADAVSHRGGIELDDEELGPHANSKAVHDGRAGDR